MTQVDLAPVRLRLAGLLAEEGLRPFARRTGIPVGVVRSFADGRDVASSSLAAICSALGLNWHFGDVTPPQPQPVDDQVTNALHYVPILGVNASAGPGLVPLESDEDAGIALPSTWLRTQGVTPVRAGLVKVQGDSMTPTIPDGAYALINTAETSPTVEGIYAYTRGSDVFIKRIVPLSRTPDGRVSSIIVMSDNPDYGKEVIEAKALNGIRIAGRVRFMMRML